MPEKNQYRIKSKQDLKNYLAMDFEALYFAQSVPWYIIIKDPI